MDSREAAKTRKAIIGDIIPRIWNPSLEKIVQLFKKKQVIEIWSRDDCHNARSLRQYVQSVMKELEKKHPTLEILTYERTNVLRNFDHPFIAGQYWGFVIEIAPYEDLPALKQSCVALECDAKGERRADIDIYLDWGKKVRREQ